MQFALLTILLASCMGSPPATPTPPFSAPFYIPTRDPNGVPATPVEPVTETSTPIPTSTPFPTLVPTDVVVPTVSTPDPSIPIAARPSYILYATLDYDGHHISVDQAVTYPNQTGVPLNELMLAVEPMLYANAFLLSSISVGGIQSTNYSLVTHRLSVPLATPLPPGGQVTLVLEYELNIPVKQKANTFGWLSYQSNLTDWYPFIVPYDPSAGWLLHNFMPFGEHLVYDSSDFDLNIRFADTSSPPIVAAPTALSQA